MLVIIFIIFIIIFILIFLLYKSTRGGRACGCQENMMNTSDNSKPYLFLYWELKNGATEPPQYIQLCFDTIRKNGTLFNVVILDNKSVLKFLPDLRADINKLPIALKSDYIRICLLYKYGGMWLDADTIMMTNMHEVIDLLKKGEDFIGFGCTGYKCTNGYGRPSNQAMAAKKNSIMMKRCLDHLNKKLDTHFSATSEDKKDFDYFDLGKLIIWDEFDKLKKEQNYKYHHFPSYVDGSRDKDGLWIAKETVIEEDIKLLDENKLMLLFLVNSSFCGKEEKYNFFCKKTKQDILNGDKFISKMFRKALGIEQRTK